MKGKAETHDDLVKRAREGDQNSLAELFVVYRNQLRSMVELRMDPRLNGRVSCSDIIQEAYIDAQKRLDHFSQKPDMPFYLWLRLVAAQRLVDVHRQHLGAAMRDVHREVTMDGHSVPNASSYSLASHLAASVDSPSQAAMKNESRVMIEQALQSMDPIDREILALRHFEEMTNDEVARLLNLKKAAASNRYVRALQRLKAILSEAQNSPGGA